LLVVLTTAQAALAVPNFAPQQRVVTAPGTNGNRRWRRTVTATSYILFPQYGAVSDCRPAPLPTIALLVSNDNGLSWQAPHALVASSTGQFDPQIMVDPVDRQTVYASWLQNKQARCDGGKIAGFCRSWYLANRATPQERRGQACAGRARRGCFTLDSITSSTSWWPHA